MSPNHDLRRETEYIETYNLPNIIVSGEKFWACSERHHLAHSFGGHTSLPSCYCYTNIAHCFANVGYNNFLDACASGVEACILSLVEYEAFSWITKDDCELIWDSDRGDPARAIVEHIHAGKRFKIAVLDEIGIWNIHSVNLPFYYPGTDRFRLQTQVNLFPLFFREPGIFIERVVNHKSFGTRCKFQLTDRVFASYYSLFSTGEYYGLGDIETRMTRYYERLKVFTERLPEGVTTYNITSPECPLAVARPDFRV